MRTTILSLAAVLGGGCTVDLERDPCPRIISGVPDQVCAEVAGFRLPDALPASRGNAHADDPRAAIFGFYNFFDRGLSRSGTVSCATCHVPGQAFQDGLTVARGAGVGTRNTPTTLNAARITTWFWDGRADSLWSVPLFAIENPVELAQTRLGVAHRVADDPAMRAQYEAAFGPLPDLSDRSRFPAAGKPGDASWDAMDPADQRVVNRIFANVGKAFEAYLRKSVAGPAPLDAFLDGDDAAITEQQRHGLELFVQSGCDACHAGPMFTDQTFRDAAIPPLPGAAEDPGRSAAIAIIANNPFNLRGAFADPTGIPSPGAPEDPTLEVRAFRVSPLRNLTGTAPFAHNGGVATLQELLPQHFAAFTPDDAAFDDLIAFMSALDGAPPPAPWNAPPAGPRPAR